MIQRWALIVALGIALGWDSRARADDVAGMGVKELEAKVLEARGALKSGEFEFRVKSVDYETERVYHTWISEGGQVRQERTVNGELQVSVMASDFAYYFNGKPERIFDPKVQTLVDKVPVGRARPDMLPYGICNPKSVMFAPGTFTLLQRVTPGMLVGAAGREGLAVKDITWNGMPAKTVSFRVPRFGNSYEYDVVPGRGFSIVEWRLTGSYRNGSAEEKFSDTLSCELSEIAPSVWFPKRMVSKQFRNGTPAEDEEVTVTAKGVNRPIPAEVFGPAWRLPPKRILLGRSAVVTAIQGQSRATATVVEMNWDGKTLQPVTRKEQSEERVARKKILEQMGAMRGISNRAVVWLGVGLVILAGAGLWGAIRAARRGHLLDLLAAVSLVLCGTLAFLWVRSYRSLGEVFLIYSVSGSEQVGLMDGKVFFQHREPDEGVRGRVLRMSARSTPVNGLPPGYWPPLNKGKRVWPGAVTMQAVGPWDAWWGLAFDAWQGWALTLLLPAAWVVAWGRRRVRVGEGLCTGCGYDLRGNTSGACPECGNVMPKASGDLGAVGNAQA